MSDATMPTSGQADAERSSALARFFLLRPTFGLLLTLLLIAGGLIAYQGLVKESLPDLQIPQATVTTLWPGADPVSMEQQVTDEIEKEIKSLKGLKTVSSASYDSFSVIAVEFQANADLTQSMQLLRTRVNDAEAELPREAEKPTVDQVSVDDRPILSIVLFGDLDDADLSRTAEALEDRLERVPGINEVKISGRREEVVLIRMSPNRLLALGLSPTKVRDAIRVANTDMPWGEIESDELGGTVRLYGQFRSVQDLRTLPVARLDQGQGRVVLLGEIAEVSRELEEETSRASFGAAGRYQPAVEVAVTKVPGSDSLRVIRNAKAALEEVSQSRLWPYGLEYRINADQSQDIWDSLMDVFNNGWQAMLGVFVVLLVMLSWREGLIAGLAIPLSFLGALVLIWALGYTLNELVIIGMVLALGLLVDVFILMMEGMHEAIFVERLTFNQAALKTVRRYALPAAAGQATTILALAPLMAISGTAGQFIRVMPATTIACLIMSFVVALLVAIPLSRYLIGHVSKSKKSMSRVDRISAALSERLAGWSLRHTLRSRTVAALWVGGALALFALAVIAFSRVPVVLYPKADGRNLGITIELPADATLATSQVVADRVGTILADKPYLESVVKLVGKKSPMAQSSLSDALTPGEGSYLIGFSCRFVPREQRQRPAFEYVDELRREIRAAVNRLHGGASVVLVPETGQPSSEDPIQVELTGDDITRLRALSRDVQAVLRDIAGTTDVRDNLGALRAEIRAEPKREALDFYGIPQDDLAAQVRLAMVSDEIGRFATEGQDDDLPIRLGMAWPSREGEPGGPTRIEELAMVRVFDRDGRSIPALAVIQPRMGTSPVSIVHKDGRRSVTVMAKTEGRTAAEIVAELRPALEEMRAGWPSGYAYDFAGEAQEAAETFGSAGAMLVVAIFLVFALLVLLFGSFAQPLVILITIPLALIGTLGGFYLAWIPFSFFAMVGVIALIGIVVNDAIVMVETMNEHLRRGVAVAQAAARGGAERLRPVVSTSLTTIIGLIPLAITNPMWRPLCYAIIFGLMASTVLSLVIVPCLYLLFTRKA